VSDQERYDPDGRHGGVAYRFGKLCTHRGADAYGDSYAHENPQYSRSTGEESLCIILTVVADFAGV